MTKQKLIDKLKSINPDIEVNDKIFRSSKKMFITFPHHTGNLIIFFERKKDNWDISLVAQENKLAVEWWRKHLIED